MHVGRAVALPFFYEGERMEYLVQLLIILGFTFAGEALSRLIPLPIPAAVYELVLLFLGLRTGLVKTEKIQTVGNWLIAIMGIFFVAPVVNLMDSWAAVKETLVPVLVIVVVSTVAVFAAAGILTQRLGKKGDTHD